jgi:hypothetical protein
MRRNLEQRIRRLEASVASQQPRTPLVLLVDQAESGRTLLPGERIVLDWVRNTSGIILASERVTVDPLDTGRRCDRDGYLEEEISKIHASCKLRDLAGGCRLCQGTPIAAPGTTREQVETRPS